MSKDQGTYVGVVYATRSRLILSLSLRILILSYLYHDHAKCHVLYIPKLLPTSGCVETIGAKTLPKIP